MEYSQEEDLKFLNEAIKEAEIGWKEGGIPIGSVLVLDKKIIGRGHNQRVQKGSPILHAEMDCLNNVGRLTSTEYSKCRLYSTLSPCDMCSGTVLLYKIKQVVIGENESFKGPEEYVKSRGVQYVNLNSKECKELMKKLVAEKPELWFEDIGENIAK